jgi:hypothetical protein
MTSRWMIPAVLCAASVALADRTWTMDDLKALDASRSHAELLEHAEDVPPTARTDDWRAMVGRAAAGVVASAHDTTKQPFAGTERGVAASKRFPFLAKDPGFQGALEASALASMKRCAQGDGDCVEPVKPALPLLRAAGLVDLGKALGAGRRSTAPMTIFAQAIGSSVDHPACRDPVVQDATLASLELPSDDEFAAAARKVAFDACWKAMEKPLKAAMVHANDALRKNACAPMRAKKALTELQDDLCKELE